jgi:3-isopropylmalate/(R)-2-methylmalate dehydratase small subunit
MDKISIISGRAAPMMQSNVDTDAIFPSRYMTDALVDLGAKLFANWRYEEDGSEKPDFMLNDPRYRGAKILIAGPNFGCGSSREQAVWALMKYGIRCVIAPSFAEIFMDNAFLNGLLPVVADSATIVRALEAWNHDELSIDLTRNIVEVPGLDAIAFSVPPDRRAALLHGVDEISFILQNLVEISAYEAQDAVNRRWVYSARG